VTTAVYHFADQRRAVTHWVTVFNCWKDLLPNPKTLNRLDCTVSVQVPDNQIHSLPKHLDGMTSPIEYTHNEPSSKKGAFK
jgi:hypothetical protein